MNTNNTISSKNVSKIIAIQFSVLSPEEIVNGSVVEIVSRDTYNGNLPAIGGIFDPRMGVLEGNILCPTDGLNNIQTPGYFGHIHLARPVFYIQFLNTIQKKCVYENLNNNNISRIHIFGSNLKEEFYDIFKEFNSRKEIILNECGENVSFKDMIDYANSKLHGKIIFIARCDIILPNQNDLCDLKFDLTNNNDIYALSRIDRLINGNLVRSDKLNKILYCNQQDAWIFKSPLNIEYNDDNMNDLLFYNKYSELYFNKILINNNYNVINDTNKLKIIRLLHENNLDNRELIDEKEIDEENEENIYILPDNSSLSKINIDKLINFIGIDDKELYNLKCYIFNEYFKSKIINEI